MKNNTPLFILIVLLVIALGFAGVQAIRNTIEKTTARAIGPLEAANQSLQTQVAEILHPTPTIIPDPITIIHSIQPLARLETIHYSIEKIITAEIGQGELGGLFGDRLLFVAHGTVVAGVDLGKLAPADVSFQGNLLVINLPAAEIFQVNLDNEKSYVYDRDTGFFTKGEKTLETKARQAAEAEIRKAALEDGILQLAGQNADTYLTGFLRQSGLSAVQIRSKED